MSIFRLLIAGLLTLMLAAPALAQDEPLLDGDPPIEDPTADPSPAPPPPPPAPAPAPRRKVIKVAPSALPAPGGMTPRKRKDMTDTDHDMVVGALGLQVVYISNIGPMMGGAAQPAAGDPQPITDTTTQAVADSPTKVLAGASLAEVGVKTWFTRKVGLDAGLGLFIGKPMGEDVDVQVGFGLAAGVPFALGVYRHVTFFAGPELDFAFWHMSEDANALLFGIKGKTGIEFHLGFIDIPRVSIVGSIAFGMRVFSANDTSEIVVGNDQGFSLGSLFQTSIALAYYL